MRKCVAEKILGNWLETILTYLNIHSLDVEVIMKAELNELKNVCIIPFKGSREKHLVELNESRTLTIKLVIIGWKTALWSTNWIMCWKIIAVGKDYSKQLAIMTMKLETSERRRHLMTNSKDH